MNGLRICTVLTALLTLGAIPTHVETWVGYRYGGANEGHSSQPSVIRRWATYVESSNSGRPASYDVCNVSGHPCFSVAYVNTNNEYFGRCGWSDAVVNDGLRQRGPLREEAWLHASSQLTYENRLFINYSAKCLARTNDTGLWVNVKSIRGPGNALAFFNSYYQHEFGIASPDYYLNDDVNVINAFDGKPAFEFRSWIEKQEAQAGWLFLETARGGRRQNVFFNGCFSNPYTETNVTLVGLRPNIVGCENENGVSRSTVTSGHVVYMLDNCARVSLARKGGIFLNGPDEDGGELARRQSTAFNWLCYVPGRVVQWEEEDFGNQYINVFPEEGIYVRSPLQSMRMPRGCPDASIRASGSGNDGTSGDACVAHGHNDLTVAGTRNEPIERREFAECYNRGVPIGGCAVIWNLSGAPVTIAPGWLRQRYGHSLSMNGGVIEQGGTVTMRSPVAPAGTSIPAFDAIFFFR